MSNRSIRVEGGTFYEPLDWRDFMRRASRGIAHEMPDFGLDMRWDYGGADRMIGMLATALAGTPMERDMAEACMWLLEHGAREEQRGARLGPFRRAENSYGRIRDLLSAQGHGEKYALCEALLDLRPSDAETWEFVRHVYLRELHSDIATLLARAAPERFAGKLPPLRDDLHPYAWLVVTEGAGCDRIIDAITAAGPAYVAATLDDAVGPGSTEISIQDAIAKFAGHPVFERAIAARLAKPKTE